MDVAALRAAHSPQAHGGACNRPSLLITWIPKSNQLSAMDGAPCWIISDWAGYLTATRDPQTLADAISLEAKGGAGTLRELITGRVPRPEITLEDLL